MSSRTAIHRATLAFLLSIPHDQRRGPNGGARPRVRSTRRLVCHPPTAADLSFFLCLFAFLFGFLSAFEPLRELIDERVQLDNFSEAVVMCYARRQT